MSGVLDSIAHGVHRDVGQQSVTDVVTGTVGERRYEDALRLGNHSAPKKTCDPERQGFGFTAASGGDDDEVEGRVVADLLLSRSGRNHAGGAISPSKLLTLVMVLAVVESNSPATTMAARTLYFDRPQN